MRQHDYVIISTSLNPNSKSRQLGQFLLSQIPNADWVDLHETELPFCDGASAYGHQNVAPLTEKIESASGVILCSAIYNYDVNAACKNLIELTGQAWRNKVVGLATAAGGNSSYMSPLGIANSLMVDFRSIIIPKFVYAPPSAFNGDGSLTIDIQERLTELSKLLVHFSSKLDTHNLRF